MKATAFFEKREKRALIQQKYAKALHFVTRHPAKVWYESAVTSSTLGTVANVKCTTLSSIEPRFFRLHKCSFSLILMAPKDIKMAVSNLAKRCNHIGQDFGKIMLGLTWQDDSLFVTLALPTTVA